jgi:F0F1-type ATP synthase membrane subunit b/b'
MNAAHPSSLDHALTKADGMALEEKLIGQTTQLACELRQEMADLGAELRQEMADLRVELRQEMADLGAELRQEMADLRVELRQEMVLLRSELRHEILQLEARMTRFMTEQLWKIMGFQAAMMGLMFAGLRTVLP